jgi:hypothetical protein
MYLCFLDHLVDESDSLYQIFVIVYYYLKQLNKRKKANLIADTDLIGNSTIDSREY